MEWDFSKIYTSKDEFYSDKKDVQNLTKTLAGYKGKLNNKKDILDYFLISRKMEIKLGRLALYVSLKVSKDCANSENIALSNEIEKLNTDVLSATSFDNVELCKNSEEFLQGLASDEDFKDLNLAIENLIKMKKHMLSEEEEKLLSEVVSFMPSYDVYSNLATVEIPFKRVKDNSGKSHILSETAYDKYITSEDRTLRKNAYINLLKGYEGVNLTLSSAFCGNVKLIDFEAKKRGYKSVLNVELEDTDLKPQFYSNLIASVHEKLPELLNYFNLKAKALKLNKLAVYDVYAPLGMCDNEISFDEAMQIVKKACAGLGQEYISGLDKSVSEGWIDVYPAKGKRGGAFMTGCYGLNPYVMLNFNGKINDTMTVGHELGHAMYGYFAGKVQPFEKSEPTIFTHEIVSTVNELLIKNYLYKNANTKEEKVKWIDSMLRVFYSTVFRQVMFSEFEDGVYKMLDKGIIPTFEDLNKSHLRLVKKYFKGCLVPSVAKYEWSRISHFYSPYYVFKYASGLLIASSIVSRLNDKNYAEKYIKFLSAGGSEKVENLLKIIDIDIYDSKVFEEGFNLFINLIKEFKELI